MSIHELRAKLEPYGGRLDLGRYGWDLVLAADHGGTDSPEVRFELTPEGLPTRNNMLITWDRFHQEYSADGPVRWWLDYRQGRTLLLEVHMTKFIVTMKEVWNQPVQVEADSREHAVEIVKAGGGDMVETGFEYNHTLDPDVWTVEKES